MPLNVGNNTILVGIRNEKGGEKVESHTVIAPEKGEMVLMRTDYALLFATDHYDSFEDLTNPVYDARTIADELEKNFGFKVELVTDPTQDEILLKLKEYSGKKFMPNDQLFVFFSGQGQYDQSFGEGYIVAKDSRSDDQAKTTYISQSVLRNVIDNIPSLHTFLLMDVCYSRAKDPLLANAGQRGQDDIYNEISSSDYIIRKLKYKTRQYITSGGRQYIPDNRPGMHSPFARKFIEALQNGGNSKGIVGLSEIKDYLDKTDPEPRAGEFGVNEPGSDFLFIRQR
jgi:hypothetical protein